jgi:hypothetical protein
MIETEARKHKTSIGKLIEVQRSESGHTGKIHLFNLHRYVIRPFLYGVRQSVFLLTGGKKQAITIVHWLRNEPGRRKASTLRGLSNYSQDHPGSNDQPGHVISTLSLYN